MKSIQPITNRLRELMNPPSIPRFHEAAGFIIWLRNSSWTDPRLCGVIDHAISIWRTWYAHAGDAIGREDLGLFLTPIDKQIAFETLFRLRSSRRPRPSVRRRLKGSLPAPGTPKYLSFMQFLDSNQKLRAVFGGLQELTSEDPINMLGIEFSEGHIAMLVVSDWYRRNVIKRRAWETTPLEGEPALIEDFVMMQVMTDPEISTRRLLELGRLLGAFLITMTPDAAMREVMTALRRLQIHGRVLQVPRKRRWVMTYMGQVAAWADLQRAWEDAMVFNRKRDNKTT